MSSDSDLRYHRYIKKSIFCISGFKENSRKKSIVRFKPSKDFPAIGPKYLNRSELGLLPIYWLQLSQNKIVYVSLE